MTRASSLTYRRQQKLHGTLDGKYLSPSYPTMQHPRVVRGNIHWDTVRLLDPSEQVCKGVACMLNLHTVVLRKTRAKEKHLHPEDHSRRTSLLLPRLPRRGHGRRVPALRRDHKAADGAARVRKLVGGLVLRLHLCAAASSRSFFEACSDCAQTDLGESAARIKATALHLLLRAGGRLREL